jgi:D-aspartate ligase
MSAGKSPDKGLVFDEQNLDTTTPVLVLGGKENALSIVRRFGKMGIRTRVSGAADCWGRYSRYCAQSLPVPRGESAADFWSDLLLTGKSPELNGSLIICCSDVAIEFVAANRDELARHYLLGDGNAKLQKALLDKRETLVLAQKAGVATPQFWNAASEEDLLAIRETVQFPVMVKPIISHRFTAVFGCKLFIIADSFDELAKKVRLSWQNDLEVMVIEMIPGPDSLLSSYYTYIDGDNQILFDYTKRIIRRFPLNQGLACYHASEWLPETAEAGKKFFQGIGFTGLGNVEFKRDPRDNKLKIIESNARFTAAQELIIQSGAPIDLIFYCSVTKQPWQTFSTYRQGLSYWYGLRDSLAFIELYRQNKIGLGEWIKSLLPMNHVTPLHRLADPFPTVGAFAARLEKTARGLL